MPGDTLVVQLTRVRLNRDWAMSDDAIVPRGLDTDLAVKMKDGGKSVRWHLDTAHGVATLDRKSTRLNSSHGYISYAVFCLKKKKTTHTRSATYKTDMCKAS